MENLKRQFQEKMKLSFDDIPINGVHLEYINWLEKRIESLILDAVIKNEVSVCDYPWHNTEVSTVGGCTKCKEYKED